MKEPQLNKKPDYRLLKQSDAITFFHMQMPRWLFCDAKYTLLSLEAKVAYMFLLNRFQLSKMNGWINTDGEIFIIFPREKLADEMGVSYRKTIACMKELLEAGLIWEHRVGRGNANHIYMAAVELSEESANKHDSAPFFSRSAKSACLENVHDDCEIPEKQDDETANPDAEPDVENTAAPEQEVQNPQVKKCGSGTFGSADFAGSDMPFSHSNKKDIRYIDLNDTELVSQSGHAHTRARGRDRPADDDTDILTDILDNCELDVLPEDDAGVFRNIITRLFYSDSFKIGNAVLPGHVIRSYLHNLDGMVLLDTREKLRQNLDKRVKNSTAYIMAALLNNIWEQKSDLMVDPYLNSLDAG